MSRYLFCLFGSLLVACSPAPTPSSDLAQPVRVMTVGVEAAETTLHATGLLGYEEETRLSFKTGGLIQALTVDAGDRVRQGQVLARLDATELEAPFQQAAAATDKARRDLARAERLYQDGVLAEQQVQDARTQLQQAQAGLSAARFNRAQSEIRAAGDGVVLRRLAEPGETVAPGAPVLVLGRQDLGWVVRAGLSERDAVRVRVGDPASIRLRTRPDQVITSTVREVGAASDPRTGTVSVTLALPAGDGYLSGQVADLEIRTRHDRTTPALTVPLKAVLEGDGSQAHVYVVLDNTRVQRQAVTLGEIRADHVLVLDGLQPGMTVVSEGAAWLNPDSRVRVLP